MRRPKSRLRLLPSRIRSASSFLSAASKRLEPNFDALLRLIVFVLDDVENLRPLHDGFHAKPPVQVQLLSELAQFGDVKLGQLFVDLQLHRRRLGRVAAHKNLDPAARNRRLHHLADLRLMLAPSARQAQLQFEKALIERAHFRHHSHPVALKMSAPESRHAPHLVICLFWIRRPPRQAGAI